jgi:type I restriction enzyme S subunit
MTALDGGQHYPFDLRTLPPGWAAAYVGQLVQELRPGFASGEHNATGNGIPHLRPMNIDRDGRLDLTEIKYVSPAKPQRAVVGDVLFNNTNSPALIGKTTAITVRGEFAYSNHMTRLRLREGLDPVFIALQLHYLWMTRYFRHRCVNHVNQASIGTSALGETVPLLVPPAPEQRRIVAKIEELFSDLDAGVAALQRVRANLKRYRAAVLKAAVEGRLTEEWRKRHPGTEPAAQLLERILAERRAKWEQDQLRKFKEAGKTPPKGWKEKYEEPLPVDAIDQCVALPNGWCWARCSALLSDLRSGSTVVPTDDVTPLPMLRSSAVRPGRVNLLDARYVPIGLDIADDDFLDDGDLLFVRLSGSIDYVAACAIVPVLAGRKIVYPDRLFRAKTVEAGTSRFVALCFGSSQVRRRIERIAKSTAGHQRISMGGVSDQPMPLPPLTEQVEIVAEVDRRLSVADAAETQVEHALQRAARLRQAILKRAFEGKLVPQDPTDEPAAVLSERIKAPSDGKTPVPSTLSRRRSRTRV